MEKPDSVRIDRWLFAVRIYKTRSLAAKAIAGGKVKLNGVAVKAGRGVQIGDEIVMKREGRTHSYKVTGLLEKRVGAKDAVKKYEVTVDANLTEDAKLMMAALREAEKMAPRTKGRPTKRDRRQIDKFRSDFE